jgi:DNA replication and repair protein RecF
VQVTAVTLRNFRSYEAVELRPAAGITVLLGPNGAGKTNLLEAIYFGCTGRSCRTTNEREVVRFGAEAARVEIDLLAEDGAHNLSVGFQPGQPKRLGVDGAAVERLLDSPHRPLVGVFLPDRLELVKGSPGLRRAHLDQVVTALRPSRLAARRAYAQALAQRNALLARIRAGRSGADQMAGWDLQLARHAVALMEDRAAAARLLAPLFRHFGALLGLAAEPDLELIYRPRSRAATAEHFAAELTERLESDLTRGFTGHGPHRDELSLSRRGRDLRIYGSQGQQRLGVLALLLAERELLARQRGIVPLLLLDDVLSELDHRRREALLQVLDELAGQTVITATDAETLPATTACPATFQVGAGRILQEASA